MAAGPAHPARTGGGAQPGQAGGPRARPVGEPQREGTRAALDSALNTSLALADQADSQGLLPDGRAPIEAYDALRAPPPAPLAPQPAGEEDW